MVLLVDAVIGQAALTSGKLVPIPPDTVAVGKIAHTTLGYFHTLSAGFFQEKTVDGDAPPPKHRIE